MGGEEMIIKVKNKIAVSLPYLARLVFKSVYEPRNMSLDEETAMQDSFVKWSKNAMITSDEQETLEKLAKVVKNNQEGKYDVRKAMFKEHDIDYRKFHRFPEHMGISNSRAAELDKIVSISNKKYQIDNN